MNQLGPERRLQGLRRILLYRSHGLRRHVSSSKPDELRARARIQRVTSRLPKFLQRYTTPLIDAPVTHVSAFLILHELTAIVPLFGLAATFHYTQWLPSSIVESQRVSDGVDKFSRYFRKKGWLNDEDAEEPQSQNGGMRVVLEFATAYAVTKALLPLRLGLSVWASPWFAQCAIVPSTRLFRRLISLARTR